MHASHLRSFTRRRRQFVEERWTGAKPLAGARSVAVFCHYDPQGALHAFVENYLAELERAGFAVVFVSNAPALPRATVDRLLPRCALVLRRANAGYDFGAYKDGIAAVPAVDGLDQLLLANDSVYGPFRPLAEVVAGMDENADVWGITDSWEHRYHLQSFFLLFRRPALQSAAFAAFWSKLRYVQSKDWIIAKCEIGLTRSLEEEGLRCRALFPYRTAEQALLEALETGRLEQRAAGDPVLAAHLGIMSDTVRGGGSLNVTHFFWDFLIERMGCPFLKRELLRDNPQRVPYVSDWKRVVAAAGSYDTGLIERHLAATLGGRPVPDPEPAGRERRNWYR